jgi:hypothetical protein
MSWFLDVFVTYQIRPWLLIKVDGLYNRVEVLGSRCFNQYGPTLWWMEGKNEIKSWGKKRLSKFSKCNDLGQREGFDFFY